MLTFNGNLKVYVGLHPIDIRNSDYVKVDETPLRYLSPGRGKTSTGQLWAYHHSEHGVLFDWHTSRANDCLDRILIGKMSKTEADCRKRNAPPGERLKQRKKHSQRIYDHLSKIFTHLKKRRSITPKSKLGKALSYARDQWPHLHACFEHGHIELENNLTENAIRPTKLGHKNWMFIGGADTGWRSAIVYTFIEQIRNHGADPFAYLNWVFEELTTATNQDDLRQLLPKAWLQKQRALAEKNEAA